MKSNNYYILIIEQMRRIKGVTIHDLIQDVISERSYRRYLKSEITPKMDVIIKLANKIEMSLYDIAFITPNLVNEAEVKNVETANFYLMSETELNNVVSQDALYDSKTSIMIEILSNRFQLSNNLISEEDAVSILKNIQSDVSKNILDIYNQILQLEIAMINCDINKIKELLYYVNETKENELHFSEYMYLGLTVIHFVYDKKIDMDDELMFSISQRVEKACSANIILFPKTMSCFYVAYYAKCLKRINVLEEYLYIYLNGLELVVGFEERNSLHEEVSRVFGIDIKEFLISKTKEYLSNNKTA